jgi:hypothetical protein
MTEYARTVRVGETDRAPVTRAVGWGAAVGVLFTLGAFLTTQYRALRAHSPWQDDPYDVVVSFTQLVVPVLVAAIVLRATLLLPSGPQVARRGADLVRGAVAVVALCAATVLTDWAAVANCAHRADWATPGAWLIGGLGVVSVLVAAAGAVVLAAARRTRGVSGADPPDWVDDALTIVLAVLRRTGRMGRATAVMVNHAYMVVFDGRHGVRRHPVAVMAVLGFAAAAGLAVVEMVREPPPNLAAAAPRLVLTLLIGGSGLFAIGLAVGRYLRVVRPIPANRPPRSRVWLWAGAGAAASVPAAVAWRDALGSLTGIPINSIGRLESLIAIVAVLSGLIAALVAKSRQYASRRGRQVTEQRIDPGRVPHAGGAASLTEGNPSALESETCDRR